MRSRHEKQGPDRKPKVLYPNNFLTGVSLDLKASQMKLVGIGVKEVETQYIVIGPRFDVALLTNL